VENIPQNVCNFFYIFSILIIKKSITYKNCILNKIGVRELSDEKDKQMITIFGNNI